MQARDDIKEMDASDDAISQTDAKKEQHQRLLGIVEPEAPNDREIQEQKRRRWLLFVVATVLVLCAVALLWRSSGHQVTQGTSSPSYILLKDSDRHAPPQRREFFWTIKDRVHNPDGIFRPMILVNDQFPGPLIEINEGDTLVVHIDNQAANATSIHWHGLYQNGTSYMDGTVGVTQCPIAPGRSFTYEFNVTGQHGTYWWHGHQGLQASDGLHGPLVVHGREEARVLEYDSDQVVLLSDHYHELSSALMFQYLMPDAENAEPVPQSALINGRGLRDCSQFSDRRCEAPQKYPVIQLEPGKRHRLRLVNVGAFAEFQFQIDEHELAVTEVDGTDVQPQTVDRLNINPAQRYSVIINGDSKKNQFWMRARMITHCFTDPPASLDPDAFAIVSYAGSDQIPTSQDWTEELALQCRDMNTSALEPVVRRTPPSRPDAFFYLRANFEIGPYRLSRGFFNTSSWRTDVRSPLLHRIIEGLATLDARLVLKAAGQKDVFVNDAFFDKDRELVVQSEGIQVIDLLISNFDDGDHPLHLHGYKYFVLAQGHGTPPMTSIDASISLDSLAPLYENLNITNPLRRDTASVEAFGWMLIRIVADNPGIWALHCHVSWHAEAGLLMQLLTRIDQLEAITIPAANMALCKNEGLELGMAPPDSVYEAFA